MRRPAPAFRTDHVGSLIRPEKLIDARREFLAGRKSLAELREHEDEAIRDVVKLQENIGFRSITDGEFRRDNYLTEFLGPIGVELVQGKSRDLVLHDDDGHTRPGPLALVNQKIRWPRSVNVEPFLFLCSIAGETPKVTIPAPTQVHFFAGSDGIDEAVYPDIEEFWDDMVSVYHAELNALGKAGCRYVQLDETVMPKLADPDVQAAVAARGHDWRALLSTYAGVMNRIIRGAPADMMVAVHHCRGNNAGWWQAQAGYDAVAEVMFTEVEADSYLLEYDTPRAGDFSPLRFMPKHKHALLGLVSTRYDRLETAEELKRRIDEATQHIALEQLRLGPQCGFSCGWTGSPVTYDSQVRKMERIVEVARDVWG